ncbi:MAG: hypothetical protein AMXMBFR61_04620 [Fimbriimonadales bacterium]
MNLACLALVTALLAQTPLSESREEFDKRMAWWREARFGMFIHWGLYAVPAGVWNGEQVPGAGEWIMYTKRIPREEYETLLKLFNPVKYDADAWVRLAKEAGMKYIVITSKHHDGFCLWDSKHTEYDVMSTPYGRDLLKPLAEACRRHGIRLCFYHSIMDWHHPDANEDRWPEYVAVMKAQLRELIENYGPLGVLWFDGEWVPEWTPEQGAQLYAELRRLQPDLIINNRIGKSRMMPGAGGVGDFDTPEQYIPGTGLPFDWESCMTMNDTWGFKLHDRNWKSTETLIRMLADTASKGGNFLLNVGPTAEGLIPEPSVERLRAIGAWLRRNGEAIYGTGPSPFRSLPWGRCTSKPGKLYLHVFDWPSSGRLAVPGLRSPVKRAWLLANGRPVTVRAHASGVEMLVPLAAPDPVNSVIVLELAGPVVVEAVPILQRPSGVVTLRAAEAEILGDTARYEKGDGKDNIGFWTSEKDSVRWAFELRRPGRYTVDVLYACEDGSAGSEFEVRVGTAAVRGRVAGTGGWAAFRTLTLGELELRTPGTLTLEVRPLSKPGAAVLNLQLVRLSPAD